MAVLSLNSLFETSAPDPLRRVSVYNAGSDTLAPLFADRGLTLSQPNPISADAAGLFPPCYVMDGSYRLDLAPTPSTAAGTLDDVAAVDEQLVPDVSTLLADTRGQSDLPEGQPILTMTGHSYVVAAADATDAHVTTAGGVGLYAQPAPGNAIDLTALGAPNDATTDISDLIDAAVAMDRNIIFPRRFAVSRTIRLHGVGRSFHFPGSSISLLPGGSFASIHVFGSDADTGLKALISIGDDSVGCKRCKFTGAVTAFSASNQTGETGFVLWAAERLGKAANNDFDLRSFVNTPGFNFVFYGQGTTSPVAGSFTGSTIQSIETGGGCGAFNFQVNQDDIAIEIIRERGQSVLATDLTVDSYFMYGSDPSRQTDGIVMGAFGSLKIRHHFVEGDFRHPVLLNGANNQYRAGLRVSSNFSSQSGNVVTCNTDTCHVQIVEEPLSRQGNASRYVLRSVPSLTATGLFEFVLTTGPSASDYISPIDYFGGAASCNDTILLRTTEGSYTGAYSDAELRYRRLSVPGLSVLDETGARHGTLALRGEASVAVVDGARYAFAAEAADLIALTSATPVTITLDPATADDGAKEVTLMSDGAGAVTLASDTTTPIRFASGATSHVLPGDRGGSLVLRWSPQQASWFEVARTTY